MTIRRLGVARALVDGRWCDGDVTVDADGRIAAVGVTPAGQSMDAVPGFVDLQVNGFAGVNFSDCDLTEHGRAAQALALSGVTSYLITIPTAAPDRYESILRVAADHVGRSGPRANAIGVHLEGPFLTRPGAHRVDWLRAPSRELCDRYLAIAPITMMTLAPETDGALDVIRHLVNRGVVVSVGHTNADAAQCHLAFDAGACAVTHLWNAQTGVTSRAPGVVGASLARPDVHAGIIADLVHVAAETLSFSLAALGDRAIVVSDASAFAGVDPTVARPGPAGATRHPDGSVRLPDGTLAGSGSPLDVQLRNLVGIGVPLVRALHSMTEAPARLLGRDDIGRLQPGARADVLVLNDQLEVVDTLIGGRRVERPT